MAKPTTASSIERIPLNSAPLDSAKKINLAETRSNQLGPHPELKNLVRKHLNGKFKRPIAQHTRIAFKQLLNVVDLKSKPLVFDSGCGSAWSCIQLSERHPEAIIVGIDKSQKRLDKAKLVPGFDNGKIHLIRAELVDFWRLAQEAKLHPSHHYLLYPNPWPKKRQVMRRWHAHPIFPSILELGGILHVRSDWEIYLRELELALKIANRRDLSLNRLTAEDEPISNFERKYMHQKRELYELRCNLEHLGKETL